LLAERCARRGRESVGRGFDGKKSGQRGKTLSRNFTTVFLARMGISNKAVACRCGMKFAHKTSATHFVHLKTISDRDGRWLSGRMRLTWPLSIAKEEGVGRARHGVLVLLLSIVCRCRESRIGMFFLSRFCATCCLDPAVPRLWPLLPTK
jgi:hypothetical protein